MTRGIPDPHGPSGTFAALERTTPIVQADDAGVPTTTSMRVANGTQVQHKNVLELIRANIADFEEFGRVAFETRPFDTAGGPQNQTVAILTEEHATLLLTYMRNSEIVRDFKKRLVREFSALRRAANAPAEIPTHAEALRGWAAEIEARELAEAKARELALPAAAYQELVDAAGDYAVADAAKVLSRDERINIGRDRLFDFMHLELRWIYRDDQGRRGWRAYQRQVDNGRLTEKVAKPYWHEARGEWVNGTPTVRITPKGLAELHRRLGGSGQLELMAVVS